LLDADLTAVRRQKARERYANLPPEKKAELNAKKRENYHRRQAEKRSSGQLHVVKFIMKNAQIYCMMLKLWEMLMAAMTDTPQSGVLHVHEVPCSMDTTPSAVFHVSGSAGF